MMNKNISDIVGQSKKKLENFTKKDLVEILSNTQQKEVQHIGRSSEDYEKIISFLDAKISNMEKIIISKLVFRKLKTVKKGVTILKL